MKAGFTLVEILIVVIVLSILASIVLQVYGDTTGDARQAARATEIHEIRKALQIYRFQAGSFPSSLDELLGTVTLVDPDGQTRTHGPWLEAGATDPTDGQPYDYRRIGAYSYALEGVTYGW